MKDVLECEFRAHPGYRFVPFDGLSEDERHAIGDVLHDPHYVGILRPYGESRLRVKAVGTGTARLFDLLASGGRLPRQVLEQLGEHAHDHVVELVLSDVLQVWCDGFVSGPEAQEVVNPGSGDEGPLGPGAPLGPLAELSRDAVRHAERLPIDAPARLAAQLYFYNRAPVTPRWHRRIGTPDAVLRYVGLDPRGALADLAHAHWRRSSEPGAGLGWHRWTARRSEPADVDLRLSYKIYVSPALEALPEATAATLEVFAEEDVRHFKIGADLPGLARPDKIIAYSDELEHLERIGRRLATRLRDVPRQGVPFTASLSEDGIVSWGLDPPHRPDTATSERASWRSWIALRLAAALIDARESGRSSIEPWQYALKRLQYEGVDTHTWTPTRLYHERWR